VVNAGFFSFGYSLSALAVYTNYATTPAELFKITEAFFPAVKSGSEF
jgi:hypothetical protein